MPSLACEQAQNSNFKISEVKYGQSIKLTILCARKLPILQYTVKLFFIYSRPTGLEHWPEYIRGLY